LLVRLLRLVRKWKNKAMTFASLKNKILCV
jgi:hypothetical protein